MRNSECGIQNVDFRMWISELESKILLLDASVSYHKFAYLKSQSLRVTFRGLFDEIASSLRSSQ